MSNSHTTPPMAMDLADSDVVLDVEDIAARYNIGRTKAYELIGEPGFPRSVVPNMTRIPLVALRAYELAVSLAGTAAEPAGERPVTLAPPPARRPGRRPTKEAA